MELPTGGRRRGRGQHRGRLVFAAFASPVGAVRAAVTGQRGLTRPRLAGRVPGAGPDGPAHWGGDAGRDNYVRIDVHRAARVAVAAHGGQVIVSDPTRALVEQQLPEGVALRDLGTHRLKDLNLRCACTTW